MLLLCKLYSLLFLELYSIFIENYISCCTVLPTPSQGCEPPYTLVIHGSHGYISSSVAKNTGCGNMDHPWRIEVQPGQRVNITLTSFHAAMPKSHRRCRSLGYDLCVYVCVLFLDMFLLLYYSPNQANNAR